MGVTLVLAGFGLFIMSLGYLSTLMSGRTSKTGGVTAVDSSCDTTYSDPRLSVPVDGTTSSGSMVLETTKYLGKKPSALPGSAVYIEEAPTPAKPWRREV
jgi:hypothetical protein